MFSAIVDHLIEEIRKWTERHKAKKYNLVDKKAQRDEVNEMGLFNTGKMDTCLSEGGRL